MDWCRGLVGCLAGIGVALCSFHAHADSSEIAPFTDEAVERGLIYAMPQQQALGHGLAMADLTGNGHQDVVLLGHASGKVGFFENDGSGVFTDRSWSTEDPSVPKVTLTKPSGVAIADYNGDGMLDVYLTQEMSQATGALHGNVLLRNDGDFEFTDVTGEAGVGSMGHSQGAAWGDFDNDGWLDLYLANYAFNPLQSVHWNKLYRNLGDGTFEEVASEMGVVDSGMTFTAAFTDMNRNGWLDLYIANDRGHYGNIPPNQLWRNDGGTYTNLCETSGACVELFSMCVAAGDVSGNGYPDFYVTNIAHPSALNGWNPLLINQGDETFEQECVAAGVCQVITSWAGIFYDYDNNGWLDLYVCNQAQPNNLFANNGTFPMAQVTEEAGVAGSTGWSYNAAVGDVTGNGALDLLLNNFAPAGSPPANVQLFINNEGVKRNWIRFDVVGYDGNVHAIGANIEVTADGHTQWREIYAGGNNYKAQNELVFHFGLDEAEVADEIVVNWPGGTVTRVLTNYPANHRWTIYPPEAMGDYTGDGTIGVDDLIGLLSVWGPVQPGAEMMDITGDGVIGVDDLISLLAKWSSR